MGLTNVILNYVVAKLIQSVYLKLHSNLSNQIYGLIQSLNHPYRFHFTGRKHYSYTSVPEVFSANEEIGTFDLRVVEPLICNHEIFTTPFFYLTFEHD